MRLSFGGKRFSRSGCFGGVRRLLAVLIVVLSPVQALSQNLTNPSERNTPGCAIGVNEDGKSVFRDAYGMADLEHGVPIQTDTIMEAGSVSKQFTAAAAVLLSLDGRLSLSDDIRKYLPELPEYDSPVEIRDLINHTNGLRDWGHIVDIEGWPRGTRVHHQQDILSIVSRQRSLNFEPGEFFSYGNSGYNLLTMIVARASGTSFQKFTQTRFFGPLGMTNTSWRDDFTQIVPKRANAYRPSGDDFVLHMPFENTFGHGGLLTTVDDLLKWNQNLQTGEIGGRAFIDEMHRSGLLNDGSVTGYASGLRVATRQGLEVVFHGGATASYRAFAAHYPEKKITVAALCNDGTGQVYRVTREVVDPFLGISVATENNTFNETPSTPIERFAGSYKNVTRGDAIRLIVESGQLRMVNGLPLQRQRDGNFTARNRDFQFESPSSNTEVEEFQVDDFRYVKMPDFAPGNARLAEYAGTYASAESEVVLTVSTSNGALNVSRGLGRGLPLTPVYRDAFIDSPPPEGQGRNPMTYLFRRNEAGRVAEVDVISDRVWRLTFTKSNR